MATPAITASNRYFDVSVTKVYYVPAIAATNLTPTRVELNAGTDLSKEIADWSGWTVTGGEIPTPDLGSLFTSKIPGRTDAEDSSLTLYADKAGVDVRTLLPRGTSGFLCFLDGGDVAGNKMDTFPIKVRSNSPVRSIEDAASKRQVSFSITREPGESLTVPA